MSNLIVVCARRPTDSVLLADAVRRCAARISPDNIRPHEPLVFERQRLAIVVANPVAGILVHGGCVCLGRIFGPPGDWWETQSEAPDGSFVIARHDARRLELLTDILSTRTLWFVHTKHLFLASTSQRALVTLLGSFELDQESLTWMLASGHLGARSWDARLRRLPGDSRLVLDRERWEVRVQQWPAIREPPELSDEEHIERLREAILDTCANLDLPMDEWLLPLSGGMDSRMLLLGLLHAGKKPRCVTWGLKSSLQDAENDARVARELANALGVEHRYCCIDDSPESAEVVVQRLVAASEGQVCEIGGYVDGFATWKGFFEDGVAGVIRGDEPGLGYTCDRGSRDDSEWRILRRNELVFLSDYSPGHPIRQLDLVEQSWDEGLRPRPGESLTGWNMRLFEDITSPATRAPGNATKCAYVEVVNPLQSARVVRIARELPDHLLVRRRSLATIVRALGPDLPLATHDADPKSNAFSMPSFVAAVTALLSVESAESVLSRPALDTIVSGLSRTTAAVSTGRGWRHAVAAVAPKRLVDRIRPVWPVRLSGQDLAFRAAVAVRMVDILSRDARALDTKGIL